MTLQSQFVLSLDEICRNSPSLWECIPTATQTQTKTNKKNSKYKGRVKQSKNVILDHNWGESGRLEQHHILQNSIVFFFNYTQFIPQ